jgi:16S rRNA C1402 (ribose-2'-O) methylase RsmI
MRQTLAVANVCVHKHGQHVDAPVHAPHVHVRQQAALEAGVPTLAHPGRPLIERLVELAYAKSPLDCTGSTLVAIATTASTINVAALPQRDVFTLPKLHDSTRARGLIVDET